MLPGEIRAYARVRPPNPRVGVYVRIYRHAEVEGRGTCCEHVVVPGGESTTHSETEQAEEE